MSRPHWTPAQRSAKLATLDRQIKLARDSSLPPGTRRKYARWAASLGEQLGILERPKLCEWCRLGRKRLERHHPDYGKPLAILFLCKDCHWLGDRMDLGPADDVTDDALAAG